MCPVIILVFSLALIMTMSGLYFLSYVRREGLGWLSRVVGTVTVTFGIVVFLGGIAGAFIKGMHGKCHNHHCKGHSEMYGCKKDG